jgi:copper oxidase (laccase) domain-containing protein
MIRHAFHVPADALWVAIGPSIRSCCYEVSEEFRAAFGPFMRREDGRLLCDLASMAAAQLRACGVRHARIWDVGRCTSCEADRWFSLRREGPQTGRITSAILLRP